MGELTSVHHATLFVQYRTLVARQLVIVRRDPSLYLARMVVNVIISLFLGGMYWEGRKKSQARRRPYYPWYPWYP